MTHNAWRAGWIALGLLAAANLRAMEVISVEAGPTTEKGIYSLDATVVVDAKALAMRHILVHLCDYREATENLSYCRVFKAEGHKSWSYSVVDLPVLDPRDYVIMSTVEQELTLEGTGTYKTCWDLAKPGIGPAPRKGVVRLGTNEGCWTMTPTDGGKKTQVRYELKLAPGGVIPSWAAGYVVKRTLPDYMRLLEKLAREAEAKGFPPPDFETPWSRMVQPLDNPLPKPNKPSPMPVFGD